MSSLKYPKPVSGSIATASCLKRPIALSGMGSTRPSLAESTSKM
jgi:hypothetical protein